VEKLVIKYEKLNNNKLKMNLFTEALNLTKLESGIYYIYSKKYDVSFISVELQNRNKTLFFPDKLEAGKEVLRGARNATGRFRNFGRDEKCQGRSSKKRSLLV